MPKRSFLEPAPLRKGKEPSASSPRYPASPVPPWRVTVAVGETVHPGVVYNLSTHGMGLILDLALAPGVDAAVELANRCGLYACRQEVRVVHSTRRADGRFLVGCEFATPMAYHQVHALIR